MNWRFKDKRPTENGGPFFIFITPLMKNMNVVPLNNLTKDSATTMRSLSQNIFATVADIASCLMKLNWLFFLCVPAFCHADFTTNLPNDFKDYYLHFRDSILTGNTDKVLALTCEKFTAINIDESVPFPKKKRVISHQKMKKHELVDRFLESEPTSTEAVDSNGRYYSIDIYENDKSLIKVNENIDVVKKVPADWKAFSLSETDIQLGGLFFSKGKSGWCWSSANYMRWNDDKW